MQNWSAPHVDVSNVPAHVPLELIIDQDVFASHPEHDPFETLEGYRKDLPIFYTPVHYAGNAGAWVLTRAEDIQTVMSDPVTFGSPASSATLPSISPSKGV